MFRQPTKQQNKAQAVKKSVPPQETFEQMLARTSRAAGLEVLPPPVPLLEGLEFSLFQCIAYYYKKFCVRVRFLLGTKNLPTPDVAKGSL